MSILIEGYNPNSNVSPIDPVAGGNNVGWVGSLPDDVAAEDGTCLSLRFDGSSGEDDVAAFQCGLDGTVVPGGLYRVWLKARESQESGWMSWNLHPPSMLLLDLNGSPYGIGLPPNYNNFWGPNAQKNLTGTLQWFSVTLRMPADTQGEMTPNSIAIWLYPPVMNGFAATRTLELEAIVVEELATS